MEMSVTDMLPLFTNQIVAKFSDHQGVQSFGRSLFPEIATTSKLASIISERGLKLIASDIERGSRGNLNVFDRKTQENIFPPYFNEYINITELDSYDYLFVEGVNASVAWGRFLDELASRMEWIMDKIDRRYELQCWQCLQTGIVTLNNGSNVTYARKAGSLVNLGAGNYFTDAAIDPYTTSFLRGSTWLNETGKIKGNTINIVFGKDAWPAYLANAKVTARDLKFNNNLEVLADKALIDSTGKIFKGATTIGAFNYQFWLYNDWYEDEAGTKTPYVDPKKIIMLPEMHTRALVYTAVPQRLKPGQTPVKSKFTTWTAIDEFQDAEFTGVKSAGIPVVGGKDQIYAEQVIA